MSEMEGQVSIFDQDTWCGKMCVAHSHQENQKETILESSWKNWHGLSKKESQFLDLRKESGAIRESSSAMDGQSLGGSRMPNIGAYLNVEEGLRSLLTSADTMHLALYLANTNTTEEPCELIPSHLSNILEENPDPKYTLSAKACLGILNRATRRGKKLPPMLEAALIQMVVGGTEYGQEGIADTVEILREMRCEIGEEALKEWVQRTFVLVQSEEVLLGEMCEPFENPEDPNERVVVEGDGKESNREEGVCALWSNGEIGDTPLVIALEGNGQRPSHKGDGYAETDKSYTLNATEVHGVAYPIVAKGPSTVAYCIGNGQAHDAQKPDKELCKTLNCMDDPMKICVAVDCRNGTEDSVNGALQSNSAHSLNGNNVVRTRYIVRRLTPLEYERLQGYPDGWTDIGEWTDSNGKKRQTSDAARYKALGNSIALPPWKWVLKRICACYERDATMASLFDGIGGFPYLWEQLNGKGTCLWASEIEEFPMAVTKVRIGGDT